MAGLTASQILPQIARMITDFFEGRSESRRDAETQSFSLLTDNKKLITSALQVLRLKSESLVSLPQKTKSGELLASDRTLKT